MGLAWKLVIALTGLVAALTSFIVYRETHPVPQAPVVQMPAGAEWHGTAAQGAALIEKKGRDDAFRQKYGVDPAFNPTAKERAVWAKMQNEEKKAADQARKDRAAGKVILFP